MEFDPTKDYSGMDSSVDENVFKWNYWELIKILVTLSNNSKSQKEIIGIEGLVADEMALCFDDHYSLLSERYLEFDLVTSDIISRLNQIDTFFGHRSGDKMPDFWNDDLLDSHPDWQKVRKMSKEILTLLGFDQLEIYTQRGKWGTETRLKNKNAC